MTRSEEKKKHMIKSFMLMMFKHESTAKSQNQQIARKKGNFCS